MFSPVRRRAKEAARGILSEVWGNRGFPVDPVWIARQLDIDVVEAELDVNISGALIKEPGNDAVIVIQASDHKNRQRFSCAHELGHYVDRRGRDDDEYDYVELRGPEASNGTDPSEVFANQFAANLLMPEAAVRESFAENQSIIVMAYRFGVSDSAMTLRLKNLNIIK